MRKILLALGLALPLSLLAATAPSDSAEFEKWVDPGWKLLATARGDLNQDGKSDAVLIVEKVDPANLKKNEEFGESVLNLNPRHLLILFKNEAEYELAARIENFLPSENNAESSCLVDPLDNGGVSIARGLLKIDLNYFMSCGGWGMSHKAWSFRYENKRFKLAGLDSWNSSRNSGESSASSRNYLTGRIKKTTGMNEFSEVVAKPSVVWTNMNSRRAFFLDDMISDCWAKDKPQEWCD